MIITFASSKGGVGKSTACACLAGAFAAQNETVHIIDLDGNHTVSRWLASTGSLPARITVTTPDPTKLTEHLKQIQADAKPCHILIDVAGGFEAALTQAVARANLTIIPAAPTEADLFEAARIARHVRGIFEAFDRQPLFRVLLTQVQALASHTQAHAIREVDRLGLPRFETMLSYRAAYQEIGFSGLPPHLSPPTRPTTQKAVAEISQWRSEITALFTSTQTVKTTVAA
jgi:chromosome partitioning protein